MTSGYPSTAEFIQELIRDYSRRGLTYPKDKAIAFSSIAKRIQKALPDTTKLNHGVFCCFLSRQLLWKRVGMKKDPIPYDKAVPTWSWLFYDGEIDFLTYSSLWIPGSQSLSFDSSECAINIEVRQFEGRYTLGRDGKHIIFTGTEEVGFLYFDMDSAAEVESQNCVVIGVSRGDRNDDSDMEYYILAVQKSSREQECYKRLGVGQVRARCVSRKGISGKLL